MSPCTSPFPDVMMIVGTDASGKDPSEHKLREKLMEAFSKS
jgi:hypothetical protein